MKNWLLSFSVIGALYVLLEILALQLFFHFLPPASYNLLEPGLSPLLQHSKRSLFPSNYIGVLGDSYALGLGDEYFDKAEQTGATYGSTGQLHQMTGRDFFSFASAGDGSIAAMVSQPVGLSALINSGWRSSIEKPTELLVFFYEGNDLNDNVEYLRKASKKILPFDKQQAHLTDYFQAYIKQVAVEQNRLYQQARQLAWYEQLYLGQFVIKASLSIIHLLTTSHASTAETAESKQAARSPLNPPGRFEWHEPGAINRVVINGQPEQIPDRLQGPSMDLTEAEKQLALISFQQASIFLKASFPQTPVTVIYIPSVITSYEIASSEVDLQSHARRQRFVFNRDAVLTQSDWMATAVERICRQQQLRFIDTRPAIRQAGRRAKLHGPLDWNHFNQHGYQVLAQTIADELSY